MSLQLESVAVVEWRDARRADFVRASAAALMIFGCFLLPFDDLPFFASAGGMGRAPAWIFLAAAGLLLPAPHAGFARAVERYSLRLWGFGLLVSAATLPFLPEAARGDDLTTKGIKVALMLLAGILVLRTGIRAAEHMPRTLTTGALLACAVLLVATIADRAGVGFIDSATLHATPNYNMRLRGTRFEASSLGAGFLVCWGLAFVRVRSRLAVMVFGAGAVGIVAITASRGTAATTVAAAALSLVALLPRAGRGSRGWRIGAASVAVALMLLLALGLGPLVTSQYWAEWSMGGSDATRSIWSVTSATSLIHYPLGEGYSAPSVWLAALFSDSAQSMLSTFSTADLSEAFGIIGADTSDTLSPKTLPALASVYWGAVGLGALAALFWKLAYVARDVWVSGSIAYVPVLGMVLVATSSYFSSPFAWEQFLLLGVLVSLASARGSKREVFP